MHPTLKASGQVNRKLFYNFQPHIPTVSSQTPPPPKCRNFTYLLYLAFLIMWPFCLCCYKHGRTLFAMCC